MWVLVDSPEDDGQYIAHVYEMDDEIFVDTCFNIEDAKKFETQEDALDFKHNWGLRAWVEKV